jgi:hypothetical protein
VSSCEIAKRAPRPRCVCITVERGHRTVQPQNCPSQVSKIHRMEICIGATRWNRVYNAACMKEELRLAIEMVQLLPPRSRWIWLQSPRAEQVVAFFDAAEV